MEQWKKLQKHLQWHGHTFFYNWLQDLKDVILLRTKSDLELPGRSLPYYEEDATGPK